MQNNKGAIVASLAFVTRALVKKWHSCG